MNIEKLNQARKRVRSFLLPNLVGIINENNADYFIENRKEKSIKTIALVRSSLRLTQEIAPDLDRVIRSVCERLQIERSFVDIYVFSSSDLNGFCFIDELPITVGLSSLMVKSLKGDELAFVLGHEIGHALFKETAYFVVNKDCLEDQIFARSIELSVDRIGLLASNSCDASFRAILKTLSGLDDSMLRYDFSHFMSEAREVLNTKIIEQHLYSSHPPLAQRFKALVSFSTSDVYLALTCGNSKGSIPIEQVNKVITDGLTKGVDAKANDIIRKSLEDLSIWIVCFLIISKKTFSLSSLKRSCDLVINKCDVEKAVTFLDSYSMKEKVTVLNEKIQQCLIDCFKLAPRATMKLINKFESFYPDVKFNPLEDRK